jgi:hypothetical protein
MTTQTALRRFGHILFGLAALVMVGTLAWPSLWAVGAAVVLSLMALVFQQLSRRSP